MTQGRLFDADANADSGTTPNADNGTGIDANPDDWVSATATRNYLLGDPLIDWLARHGRDHGFTPDDGQPDYDERLEFGPFIMGRGIAFEAAVAAHFKTLGPVTVIAEDYRRIRDPQAALDTLEAMAAGHPVIHQGVLHDAATQTYGAPDFLVRSDALAELFPGALSLDALVAGAPALDARYHYVVVDAKFTTLHLLASGFVGNSGSSPAYKGQLFIYNRALGNIQGYTPETAFLLGRGWEQTKKGETARKVSAFDRLGPVVMDAAQGAYVDAAVDWVRRVRREGAEWEVLPEPSVPELYPDATNTSDFPWHGAKSLIAKELDELTMLWWVGAEKRDAVLRKGITRWTDPRITPELLGVTGERTQPTLQAIIDVQRDDGGPVMRPATVTAAQEEWRTAPAMEFFVDFETVSNLNDDLAKFPEQNGQPLIYMIGCGHVQDGEWVFRTFTTPRLTEADEAETIDAWISHMGETAKSAGGDEPGRVIHWSFAEPVNYQFAYDSARKRHPNKGWPELAWFDLWDRVFKAEPIVLRGALSFGLKAVAKTAYGHGLIETSWGESKVDGLGAMVGAWWCDTEAATQGVSMRDLDLMKEIEEYNEVDCKVMMELLYHLRENH
jgi:hypothetical protein